MASSPLTLLVELGLLRFLVLVLPLRKGVKISFVSVVLLIIWKKPGWHAPPAAATAATATTWVVLLALLIVLEMHVTCHLLLVTFSSPLFHFLELGG